MALFRSAQGVLRGRNWGGDAGRDVLVRHAAKHARTQSAGAFIFMIRQKLLDRTRKGVSFDDEGGEPEMGPPNLEKPVRQRERSDSSFASHVNETSCEVRAVPGLRRGFQLP